MKKCSIKHFSGFTLIELLVVVLIIGILAAVAVPQYQKTVWKTRNVQLKQFVSDISQVQKTYFLAHGKYAGNFDELDIDLPLSKKTTTAGSTAGVCKIKIKGEDALRQGNKYEMILYATDLTKGVAVYGMWTEDPYKCSGFYYWVPSDQLTCVEQVSEGMSAGSFCEKIEHATNEGKDSAYWRFYAM